MNRRSFFKSSVLWLAGLIVAPHLNFAESMTVGVGRDSTWMLDNLGIPSIPSVPLYPFGLTFSLYDAYEMFAEAIRKSVDEFDEQERCQAVLNYVLSENYEH